MEECEEVSIVMNNDSDSTGNSQFYETDTSLYMPSPDTSDSQTVLF